ncbi:MAG: 5'-methylthioadenosine/S-adenosylhomocysteine nucleosidase [Pseudomonadota bacterium]
MFRWLAWILFAALAAITLPAAADDQPRIAVVSAFDAELQALLDATDNRESQVINNVRFTTGTLEGKDVVLFLSGISMTNAAMTTQMALDHFNVTLIVFSGIAGGVDPALSIGDVVIAGKWSPYLDIFMAREVNGEHRLPGFFEPTLPSFGVMYPRGVRVFQDGEHPPERRMWFEIDPALLETAKDVADQVDLSACGQNAECLSQEPEIEVGGNGVSGSAFVDNATFRSYVFDTFEARVLDMESAAVAQVAHTNETPFIAFRSLSDLAGGGEGENEIATFFGLAADNAATVVRAFLRALPE